MKKIKFILIIDDSEIDTLISQRMIALAGVAQSVHNFYDGFEAINYFRNISEIDEFPELIFLDINMPRMNGFEFLKEYNKLPEYKKKSRIIILTSSDYPKDVEVAKQLGCSDYFVKPLSFEQISDIALSIESLRAA